MASKEEITKRIEDLKKARPKKNRTFTSRRGETRLPFQKARYSSDEKFGGRVLVDDAVRLTVQKDTEFDPWALCLGSKDGKIHANPVYLKLCTEGYLKGGNTVILNPADLQEFLEVKRKSDTNSVIYWEDRDRPEAEKNLEAALAEKTTIINASQLRNDVLTRLLRTKGVDDQAIKAELAKAQQAEAE